ncbi:MAG TPA: hypothetical protein VH720_03815, partial [Candidatus Limnocylindrales bacterium]
GLVRRFGAPGWAFTRPLAAGLTTLGLVGLLVATLPSAFPGVAGSPAVAPAASPANERSLMTDEHGQGSPAAAPSEAAESAGAPAPVPPVPAASPAPSRSPSVTGSFDPDVAGEPGAVDNRDTSSASPGTARGEPDAVVGESGTGGADAPAVADGDGSIALAILAGAALLVGIGLFALRWAARRLA